MSTKKTIGTFDGEQQKAIIEKIHELTIKHGYSLRGLAKAAKVSTGGLERMSKGISITPSMANILSKVFGYETWVEMMEGKGNEPDRIASLEFRVTSLEKELLSLKALLEPAPKKSRTTTAVRGKS